MSHLTDLAEELLRLRMEKEAAEEVAKNASAAFEEAERRLYDELIAAELDTIKVWGYSFRPDQKTYASIRADVAEKALRVFPRHGMGGLIKRTIAPQTLSAWVREQMELNDGAVPKWIAPYLNLYQKPKVSIRNSK